MAMEAGGEHLKNKELERQMKAEITERISELQKLRELRPWFEFKLMTTDFLASQRLAMLRRRLDTLHYAGPLSRYFA